MLYLSISCSCLTLPDQQTLRLRSPVLKQQACPQWKHSFVFNGVSTSQLRQASLELTVWDHTIFGMSDRLLGGAKLGARKSGETLVGPVMVPRGEQGSADGCPLPAKQQVPGPVLAPLLGTKATNYSDHVNQIWIH